MKLFFAAPASGLPSLPTALVSQASCLHFLTKLVLAAPTAPCRPCLRPWFRMTGRTPSRQQTRKSEQQGEFASFVPSNKSDVEMGLGRQLTANTCPHATHGQLESCGSRLRQSDNGYFPGVSKIAEHAFTVIDSAGRTCGIYCCGVRTPPAESRLWKRLQAAESRAAAPSPRK